MKKIILALSVTTLLLSCDNSTESGNAKKSETSQDVIHEEHADHAEAIELNNGNKWVVNEEMKPYVNNGEQAVNQFLNTGAADYTSLAAQVKTENNRLIKSCTMDGKSHDELHKWLAPHLAIVNNLEKETDSSKMKATALELQKSYQKYHQYFQ